MHPTNRSHPQVSNPRRIVHCGHRGRCAREEMVPRYEYRSSEREGRVDRDKSGKERREGRLEIRWNDSRADPPSNDNILQLIKMVRLVCPYDPTWRLYDTDRLPHRVDIQSWGIEVNLIEKERLPVE